MILTERFARSVVVMLLLWGGGGGCGHYTAKERARQTEARCQWIAWSGERPPSDDCDQHR